MGSSSSSGPSSPMNASSGWAARSTLRIASWPTWAAPTITSRWPFILKYSGSPTCWSASRPPSRAARMATSSRPRSSSVLTSICSIAGILNFGARARGVAQLGEAVAYARWEHQARVVADAEVHAVRAHMHDPVELLYAGDHAFELSATGYWLIKLEIEINSRQEHRRSAWPRAFNGR